MMKIQTSDQWKHQWVYSKVGGPQIRKCIIMRIRVRKALKIAETEY